MLCVFNLLALSLNLVGQRSGPSFLEAVHTYPFYDTHYICVRDEDTEPILCVHLGSFVPQKTVTEQKLCILYLSPGPRYAPALYQGKSNFPAEMLGSI